MGDKVTAEDLGAGCFCRVCQRQSEPDSRQTVANCSHIINSLLSQGHRKTPPALHAPSAKRIRDAPHMAWIDALWRASSLKPAHCQRLVRVRRFTDRDIHERLAEKEKLVEVMAAGRAAQGEFEDPHQRQRLASHTSSSSASRTAPCAAVLPHPTHRPASPTAHCRRAKIDEIPPPYRRSPPRRRHTMGLAA